MVFSIVQENYYKKRLYKKLQVCIITLYDISRDDINFSRIQFGSWFYLSTSKASTYLPLTHTTFYTLLSLDKPLHGYGIMQRVEESSNGEVKLGPGTLYGALRKLEKQQLIYKVGEDEGDRRKLYQLTNLGEEVIKLEFKRLNHLVKVSKEVIKRMGDDRDGEKSI